MIYKKLLKYELSRWFSIFPTFYPGKQKKTELMSKMESISSFLKHGPATKIYQNLSHQIKP